MEKKKIVIGTIIFIITFVLFLIFKPYLIFKQSVQNAQDDAAKYNNHTLFSQLTDKEFVFASGVGGWATEFTINSEGLFKGVFHDRDFDRTVECEFSGLFLNPKQIDEYTFSIILRTIFKDRCDGIDSVYGLENCKEFIVYCPGKKLTELDERCLGWLSAHTDIDQSKLQVYCIYNTVDGYTFAGYDNRQ